MIGWLGAAAQAAVGGLKGPSNAWGRQIPYIGALAAVAVFISWKFGKNGNGNENSSREEEKHADTVKVEEEVTKLNSSSQPETPPPQECERRRLPAAAEQTSRSIDMLDLGLCLVDSQQGRELSTPGMLHLPNGTHRVCQAEAVLADVPHEALDVTELVNVDSERVDGPVVQDDGHSEPVDGVVVQDDGHSQQVDGVGEQDDGHSQQVDGVVEQDDGHSQQVDGIVEQDDGHSQQVDGVVEQDDGHSQQVDGVVEQDDGDLKEVTEVTSPADRAASENVEFGTDMIHSSNLSSEAEHEETLDSSPQASTPQYDHVVLDETPKSDQLVALNEIPESVASIQVAKDSEDITGSEEAVTGDVQVKDVVFVTETDANDTSLGNDLPAGLHADFDVSLPVPREEEALQLSTATARDFEDGGMEDSVEEEADKYISPSCTASSTEGDAAVASQSSSPTSEVQPVVHDASSPPAGGQNDEQNDVETVTPQFKASVVEYSETPGDARDVETVASFRPIASEEASGTREELNEEPHGVAIVPSVTMLPTDSATESVGTPEVLSEEPRDVESVPSFTTQPSERTMETSETCEEPRDVEAVSSSTPQGTMETSETPDFGDKASPNSSPQVHVDEEYLESQELLDEEAVDPPISVKRIVVDVKENENFFNTSARGQYAERLRAYDEYLADPQLSPTMKSQVLKAKANLEGFFDESDDNQ